MKIKRIIDIEDNYEGMSFKEALHELNDCVFPVIDSRSVAFAIEILSAIEQSIPYNPSGDLISRSWVEHNVLSLVDAETRIYAEARLNNAPAVEAYPFEQVRELIELNQQFAQEIENLKRPQGEWIFVNPLQANDGGAYMCSNCKTGDYGVERYRYCPFCGADMREVKKMNDERLARLQNDSTATTVLSFIVNTLGINLCSVKDIRISRQKDGQLKDIQIVFNTSKITEMQRTIAQWRLNNPKGRKVDCHRDTGISRPTINKYWVDSMENENEQED